MWNWKSLKKYVVCSDTCNTLSLCALAPHYKQLTFLHLKLSSKPLITLISLSFESVRLCLDIVL